ncbi:hypothetical protein TRFO_30550 [Tritrichomonas foetus]|uniref:Uncharacterized protein n=1 Tax=Tritrichomonas foetus TaxID=1144522 RepID=A0A1J4JVE8_9EUKA|nr:hypothetical protein TRFO_30550 [Tritrichomonas foetus]|eukprot:OHT02408.1 hypothetical protein TRFO_30550 [Tritrichomonas foetus]
MSKVEKPGKKPALKTGSNIVQMMEKLKKTKSDQAIKKTGTLALPQLNQLPRNTDNSSNVYTHLLLPTDAQAHDIQCTLKIRTESISLSKTSPANSVLTNKYYFTSVTANDNYEEALGRFHTEIVKFMSGGNAVLATISESSLHSTFLNNTTNYILNLNRNLEKAKQREFGVKFYDDINSSKLLETTNITGINFDDINNKVIKIALITPNDPPFSYLFLVNLTEYSDIRNFADIVYQIRKKKDKINTNLPIFRQISQICKKNSTISIILMLSSLNEKLMSFFSLKKKSFIIDDSLNLDKNEEDSSFSIDPFASFHFTKSQSTTDQISSQNLQNMNDSLNLTVNGNMNQNRDFENFLVARAENEINESLKATDTNDSIMNFLQMLSISEKENQSNVKKIEEIHQSIEKLKTNLDEIKKRSNLAQSEVNKTKSEIQIIEEENEKQQEENERLKRNIREMILRNIQLKAKFDNLMIELRERDESVKEKRQRILNEKEKELKEKITQNEEKFQSEFSKRNIKLNEKSKILFSLSSKSKETENEVDHRSENINTLNKMNS